MTHAVKVDDPRLFAPQCSCLQPVEIMHENPWFTVRNRQGFFTIEYNRPQTLVLPIVDDSGVVFVKVKRPIIADSTWELPAGGVEENETPIEATKRELAEETGIRISDLERFQMLPPLSITPRYPCFPFIFQVSLTMRDFQSRNSHDDEVDKVAYFSFQKIINMIKNGEIYNGLQLGIVVRFLLTNNLLKLNDEI